MTGTRWVYFTSSLGAPKPLDEMKAAKLSDREVARVEAVLARIATGTPRRGDHDNLGDGIQEVRVDGDHRQFRLYFSEVDSKRVLLALHFVIKKQQKTRPQWKRLALKRLHEYESRAVD